MAAAPDLQIVREPPVGFDLLRTLAPLSVGRRDPAMRIDRGVVWRATHTPCGPATWRAQTTDRGIHLSAWGEGTEWVVEHHAQLLGFVDRPEAFVTDHPIVRPLLRRDGVAHLPRTRCVYERLVPVVLQQLVTWREARRAYGLVVDRYGVDAPGPARLRMVPPPSRMAELSTAELVPCGVLARQARTLREIGRLEARLQEVATMEPVAARRRLQTVAGIGPWTSALVTAVVHGDADATPVGDYHLPREIGWALARDRTADDARMLQLLEPFAGHRWRAIGLLRRPDLRPPRRGPRRGMRPLPRARG